MKNPWMIADKEVQNYNDIQYKGMYRSTNFVISCLRDILNKTKQAKKTTVLDVGCSAGANLYHIAKEYSQVDFTGIDINNYFLKQAKKIHEIRQIKNTTFLNSDYKEYNIEHNIIGSSQFLEALDFDNAKRFQHYCFDNAKDGVYFLALFSEKELDYEIYIHDYIYKPNKKVPYCIYSLPKLNKLAESKGFKLIKNKNFIIDCDLPDIHLGRGTYTKKDNDNNRMQFSDVLYMPWKFLFFKKNISEK